MQSFDELEIDKTEVEAPKYDKYSLQKQRLLFNVTRSQVVIDALSAWLASFEGGLSKDAFMKQVLKLDFNDDTAIEQINKSKGKRSIVKVKTMLPVLPQMGDVIQLLASGTLFIAVNGREKAVRSFVRNTYQTLKNLGRTYVLDLNELKLEWVEKYKKGRAEEIMQKSKEAEFLIIVGFEAPLDLANYIGDWIGALRRYRVENKLPMIMPYARYLENTHMMEYFNKYSVK